MAKNQLGHVTVVGAGYMGKGIAHTLARAGATVILTDASPDQAEQGHVAMLAEVAKAERDGLLPLGSLDRVRAGTSWAPGIAQAVADAQFVMEVVTEDKDVKVSVLTQIEQSAPEGAIIATNTSAIPISVLAASLRRPERFFGVHWYNPAPYLPGIEIICGESSDQSLLAGVIALLRAAGKDPVTVADTPGFVANRLQFALFREAALMVEEGRATPRQIDAVVRSSFGFRLPFFGPFAIADMAGLDVYASAFATLEEAYGDRFKAPEILTQRVLAGDLGTKTGGGLVQMSPEELTRTVELRDRSYAALSDLRSRLSASDEPCAPSAACEVGDGCGVGATGESVAGESDSLR
ncbi:MAG: 3-hydroxyacyl-CoA dehydrogenase family protein, partial [Propionibacteriaceae bacterium]|nr:3-hydroxyacyl-CoA dehydrogenase family protein [Propionibacteriaceae bacterium]